MATWQTETGEIESGVVYEFDYIQTTPGPDEMSGTIEGYWDGHVDTWGKLTIQGTGHWAGETYYLFPHEIYEIERVA